MAAIVVASTLRFYDPNQLTVQQRMMRALQNQLLITVGSNTIDASEAARRALFGGPQFEIRGTTDTNTAAASSSAVNLTNEGVLFPANTYRDIDVETVAFNGANRFN